VCFLSETDNAIDHWSEDNSADFLELGELFVPRRAEQLTTLLDLLPALPDETFTVVELVPPLANSPPLVLNW
jgi:hypothetical protein